MRDGEIYNMLANTNKRVNLIYKQMVFIDTRLQAFEKVLSEPFAGFKGLFTPENILKRVNNIQLELMRKHDQDLKEKAEVIEEELRKPRLTLLKPNGVVAH